MKHFFVLILVILSFVGTGQAPTVEIQKIEPPFWWTGMQNPNLQILVYGKDIGFTEPTIEYPGITLLGAERVENPNYLFINLKIDPGCEPGMVKIRFSREGKEVLVRDYRLLPRKEGSADRKGFDRTDVLYLLMPDRFANGDPSNDAVEGMRQGANRSNPDGRHGGDIQGIVNHLDYIQETGFTGLWINPLLENDNPDYSYHGYAITDFYKIDPRYGTNEDYVDLVTACHEKNLKVVMDVIFNHSSTYHWFIQDVPMQSWYHQNEPFTKSNFRATTIMDPHASEFDKKQMLTGWFDNHMADLDQRNPLLANYLIQNTVWWIEYSGIDGLRVDTQPYPYKEFLSDWGRAVLLEYPNFNIVGEAWLQKEAFTAYFQEGANNPDGYNSHIPSVTDFPMYFAFTKAFIEEDSWTDGLMRFYYVLAQDFLYPDPFENLIFVDNHDLSRYYTSLNADFDKWKMAMVVLSTMRGIPCIYYGTELLMEGNKDHGHGYIRQDFPGGWETDTRNAFTRAGRTEAENNAYSFLQNLLQWRKEKDVIHHGQFKHFLPEDNVYVYFRYSDSECVMVAMNSSRNEMKALDTKRFEECLNGYTAGVNIVSGEAINYLDAITIPPQSALILELKR